MHQQENIFTAKKRTANDTVKQPYFHRAGPTDEDIEKVLTSQAEENHEKFEKYMQNHYVTFNHKINKCKYSCVDKGKTYGEIKSCYSGCEVGLKSFRRFVDQRIQQMQMLLNQCITEASGFPNSLMETYRCYELYNKGFPHLRSVIKEESLYYK